MQNRKMQKISLDFIIYLLPLLFLVNGILYQNSTFSNILLMLTTAVLIVLNSYALLKRRKIYAIHLAAGLGIMVGFINTLINGSGLGSIVTYTNLMLLLTLSVTFTLNEKQIRRITDLLIFSVILILCVFSDQRYMYSNYYSLYPELTTVLLNPNTVSILYLFLYIYGSYRLRCVEIRPFFKRIISVMLFATVVYRIMPAGGRAAIFSIVLFAFLMFFNPLKNVKERKIVKLFRYGLVATLLIAMLYVALYAILDHDIKILEKSVFSGRQEVWRQAFQILSRHWLFGYTNKYAFIFNDKEFLSAHNSLLAEWFIFGMIPCACCIICLVEAFRKVVKVDKSKTAVYAILSTLLLMTFETILTDANLYYYYAMFFVVFSKEENYDSKKNSLLLVRRKAFK